MSKQFLQTHTIVPPLSDTKNTDIFSIAVTQTQILSVSGNSSIKVHKLTFSPDEPSPYPLIQTLDNIHPVGAHHICVSNDGKVAASSGFSGEVIIWHDIEEKGWKEVGRFNDDIKAGEIWCISLSSNGEYLAGTTHDGRINVYSTIKIINGEKDVKIREYETKGSFGMTLDLSLDGELTASGHSNGSIYIFNNTTGKLLHSLQGLVKSIRTVTFSPGCKYLAAGGDSNIIVIYDVKTGEQIMNFTGNSSWIMSLSWNWNGEYLLSGSYDGKIKVWSIERRECVATQTTELNKTIWSVKWIPPNNFMRNETFVIGGANQTISFYREASGS